MTLATSQSDAQGQTNVLGGDANLAKRTRTRCCRQPDDVGGGVITNYPYEVSHLKSLAVAAAERAGGTPIPPHDSRTATR